MMAGLLFARAGVSTVLLEKHGDFLRDFRGDTIHPSTLEVMAELGVLESFLQRPHQEVTTLGRQSRRHARQGGRLHASAHALQVRGLHAAVGLPQLSWRKQARRYPAFDLRMQTRAEELLWEDGRVVGVRAQTPDGAVEIRADLTMAADGRESVLRRRAGLDPVELGAPMDVLWLRLTKRPDDPHETFGYIRDGRIMALIDRGAYWQCAYVIPKGTLDATSGRGLGGVSPQRQRDRARFSAIASTSSRAGTTLSC